MDGQIHHHLSILPTSCARVFPWLRTPNTGFPSVAGSRLRNLTVLTAPNRIALSDSNRPVAVIQAWDLLGLLPDQQPPAPFLIQTGSVEEDFTFCRERFDRIDVTPSHLRS